MISSKDLLSLMNKTLCEKQSRVQMSAVTHLMSTRDARNTHMHAHEPADTHTHTHNPWTQTHGHAHTRTHTHTHSMKKADV